MEIRPNVLRQELMEAHADIKRQIEATKDNAISMNIPPHEMRDTMGGWVLAPLLVAQVQCLHALAILNNGRKS